MSGNGIYIAHTPCVAQGGIVGSIKLSLILIFLLSGDALAVKNDNQNLMRPPNFNIDQNKKAVFVDFLQADYRLSFSQSSTSPHTSFYQDKFNIIVKSNIKLQQFEKGHILIDLKPDIFSIKIDGIISSTTLVDSPEDQNFKTQLVKINSITEPGVHNLEIFSKIKIEDMNFGLWLNDWDDRGMLERYVPTNLQYDQYLMNFNIVKNKLTQSTQIMTNGTLKEKESSFSIKMPDNMNSSSIFLHMIPKYQFTKHIGSFHSISNKVIPIEIYTDLKHHSTKLEIFHKVTVRTLKDLEELWGPWPHNKVILAFDNCMRSMEHSGGARICRVNDIAHELAHSYWGRSLFPADGNSSWLDEAVVTWSVDFNGQVSSNFTNAALYQRKNHNSYSNNGKYFRATNQDSYHSGSGFISKLGTILNFENDSTGNKLILKCLKSFYDKFKNQTFLTSDFQDHYLNSCSSKKQNEETINLLFQEYVY